jgi:23S rRNA pseudouridine2605 synthase
VPPEEAIGRLRRGIALEDGVRTAPAEIKRVEESETNSWFEVVLHEGRNQQIRRMFDAIGHSVTKLRRVKIGFLKDERLAPKQWRMLTPAEVARFMSGDKRKRKPQAKAKASRVTHGARRS